LRPSTSAWCRWSPKAHVTALATGESWLEKGATILLFGPPGAGKSHLGSAIGHALIDAGHRVLFTRTSELVQKLQAARQSLQLPSALAKLDRFDLIILDDLSYARKDQAETSVLFELIVERYERKSLLITANQPFSGWNDVFPDPGMTVAAIDRLVHHSTIFELNFESYRRRKASDKQSVRALTQVFCYRAQVVASCNLLPVRMLAGATYDEAAQHDNTTGIDRGSR
jgi:DNA replication protein DnaC